MTYRFKKEQILQVPKQALYAQLTRLELCVALAQSRALVLFPDLDTPMRDKCCVEGTFSVHTCSLVSLWPGRPSPPLPSSLFLSSRLSRFFRNSRALRALLARNSIPSSASCCRHLIPMSSPSQGSFTSLCGFVSSSSSLALSIHVTIA